MTARIALVAVAVSLLLVVAAPVPASGGRGAPAADAPRKRCPAGAEGARCRRRVACTRRHLRNVAARPLAARRAARRRWRRCLARHRGQDPRPEPPRSDPSDPATTPDPGGEPSPAPGAQGPGRAMSVTAREWSLTKSRAVLAAGTQTIELRNCGEDPHNLVISPDDGSHDALFSWADLEPGGLSILDTALPAGRYRLWCSLQFHEGLGMTTTLQVE